MKVALGIGLGWRIKFRVAGTQFAEGPKASRPVLTHLRRNVGKKLVYAAVSVRMNS